MPPGAGGGGAIIKSHGVKLVSPAKSYIHAKSLVVDSNIAYVPRPA